MITKRIVFCLVLLFVLPLVSMAAMTQSASDLIEPSHVSYLASGNEDLDKIYIFCLEVETILEAWTMAAEENDIITFPTNGATIDNATNGDVTITEAGEDLRLRFSTNNVELLSRLGVLGVDFNDLYLVFNEISAPSGNPAANLGWLYVKDNGGTTTLYFEDPTGTVSSCIAGAGTPAGSDTQMQYNNAGAFGAISTIIWDDTNLEFADDVSVAFGTAADWLCNFDDSAADQLLWITANTAATATTDPMFQILVGTTPTADQQVFGVAKGTQGSNTDLFTLDEDGDAVFAGDLTVSGTFYQAAIAAAASGNVALALDGAGNGAVGINQTGTGDITLYRDTVLSGALDVAGATTLDGAVTLGDATGDNITITGLIVANVTLDDGTTDSPSLILKDATDETCAILKLDNGDTTVTIPSDTDFEIVTGNLAVGNGPPGTVAMDGEDFYVNGDSEFDGAVQLDGAVTFASTLGITGTATIGTANITVLLDVDEEIDIDFDNADEEMSIVNSAEYGADGAQVTIENTDADVGAAMYLLRLRYTDDGQANADFAVFEDNNGDDMIAFTDGGGILAAGTIQAATLKATTLLDVDEAVDIDLNANDEEVRIDSTAADYAAGSGILEIYDDSTGQANASYLLRLAREADGDAQDHFILCEDNSTGADNDGDDMFKVDATGAVTIAGALTASGSITGDGGDTLGGYLFTTTDDIDNETLLVGDSGEVFTNQGDANTQVYTLPAAVDGVWYTFADVETAGNADLCILAVGDDTINGGSAAEYYNCYNDTVGDSVTLVAISGTEWIVISKVGTWTNDSDTTAP